MPYVRIRKLEESLMSQQAPINSEASMKTPGYAWVVLLALYLATLAAPLNLFKVPPAPVAGALISGFSLTNSEFGMLMSIFSIMGFVLAIPAGYILKRFGIKMTGLIAVGSVTIGSVLGALAKVPDGIAMLYAGRFIEGMGMGLIMVAAPLAISIWFPPNNRALPTGLWASCVGVGNVVTLIFAPMIMISADGSPDWHRVWWACAAFSAVAFTIFALLFRMPKKEEMFEAPVLNAATQEKPPSFGEAASNSSVWMIAIAFGCYNLVVMALCTYLPIFLQYVGGKAAYLDKGVMQSASFLTSFIMMASIFSGPLGGYISDRLGKRKIVILIPYILMTLTFFFPFTSVGWQIPAYMIIFGIFGGPLAPILLASIPEVSKRPQLIGLSMSIGALCQNIGMFIGPAFFGWILDYLSAKPGVHEYAVAGYWMLPFCLLGIIATLRIKIR
jgi:MFS family permease